MIPLIYIYTIEDIHKVTMNLGIFVLCYGVM